MPTIRAILFAIAALGASVGFTMAAFGTTTSGACTPANIEARLVALEQAAEARPADVAQQHRMAEAAAYARIEVARFAPADRHQACRFLDRMLAGTAMAGR